MNSPISVVYENSTTLAINKPAGILTHPRNGNDTRPSVVSWLLEHYPQIQGVGTPSAGLGTSAPLRPGIVHRLDADTSGVLIIAKTQASYEHLKQQFHDRLVTKTYVALVYGRPLPMKGVIDAPLFKFGTRQSLRPSKKKELTERAAVTEYATKKIFADYTLLEVKPKTGRTHQIRIHLRSIGTPIVCDPMYAFKTNVCPPELGRLFLHAQSISFADLSGGALTLETELAPELMAFLEHLQKNEV